MPGRRRASIVFPVPGGPTSRRLCDPAAAISRARRARSCPRTSARSGSVGRPEDVRRHRVEVGSVDLSPEIGDGFRQVPHGHGLDARKRRLGRRFCGADDTRETRSACTLGNRERSGYGSNAPVQRKLADCRVLRQPLWRDLARRGQDCERDRQVEPRPLLAQRSRCEVDGDAPVERPLERGRDDAASNAVLGFLARAIDETDDREPRDAGLEVGFDLDATRLEADERLGDRACEHPGQGRRGGVKRA